MPPAASLSGGSCGSGVWTLCKYAAKVAKVQRYESNHRLNSLDKVRT